MSWTKKAALMAAVIPVAVLAATSSGSGATRHAQAVSGSITFEGVWTGPEASAFGQVIKAFNKTYPQVKVNYKPVGDNLPTVLSTAVAGGHPPDMADIAQPGLVKQFADQGKLKPVTYAKSTFSSNFSPAWLSLSTFNGKLYGLVFKASNKSTVWYNVHAFKTAGVARGGESRPGSTRDAPPSRSCGAARGPRLGADGAHRPSRLAARRDGGDDGAGARVERRGRRPRVDRGAHRRAPRRARAGHRGRARRAG